MSQKSILSFFSKTNVKTEPENEKSSKDTSGSSPSPSPEKVKIVKRKRIISSSEEESPKKLSSPPSKKVGSPEKNGTDKEKTVKTSPIKVEKKTPKGKSKVKQEKNEQKESKKTPKSSKKASVKNSKLKEKPPKNDENSSEKDVESPKKEKDSPKKEEDSPKKEEISPKKEEKDTKVVVKSEDNKDKTANVLSFFTNKKDDAKPTIGKDGADYNPGKKGYHPINDAFWKKNEKVPYLALARTFQIIEETSGRLRMIEILSNFFRSVIVLSPNDLLPCVYLSLNQLAPAYEGMELGIAEFTLMKAIAQSTGRSLAQIKADSLSTGDLGIVAEQSKSSQRMMFKPVPNTVLSVFNKLREIATLSGKEVQSKKIDKIQSMFVACRHSEARFIIRSLAGKLRIGLAEQSLLQAIAQACAFTPPNQTEEKPILNALSKLNESQIKGKVEEISLILKTVYCHCPNYNQIIPVLLKDGIEKLPKKCPMTPGTPLKPMLAHPTKGVNEVLERFDGIEFTCEWKYDGERAQIHILEDGTVNIYSRNQENNTTKYPDVIARINNTKKDCVKSAILDCEAVAWDPEKKQILPFQVLSTRKRKDANESDIKVQVCVYMFDLLYFNGCPLVEKPFLERRELLYKNFKEIEGEWKYATRLDTKEMDELQTFLDDAIKGNCEGLMVKTLKKEATYEIAKRSRNWLKLKKDYLSGVGDSLDLVVIGGYRGRGKRTGTYGGFLLACYDEENEEYQSICKIGTGFTDEDLQKHTEFLKDNIIKSPKSYYRYDASHEPDDWFVPAQVWEVLCADLSLSPVHRAAQGIVDSEKGISLRFPRFIRIRDDKSVNDATSAKQVADMYSNQDQIKNQQNNQERSIEEDFY